MSTLHLVTHRNYCDDVFVLGVFSGMDKVEAAIEADRYKNRLMVGYSMSCICDEGITRYAVMEDDADEAESVYSVQDVRVDEPRNLSV